MQELYITDLIGEIKIAGLNADKELVHVIIDRKGMESKVGQISMARVMEVNKSLSVAYVKMGNCDALLSNVGKLQEGDKIPLQIIRDGFGDKMPATHTRLFVENRYFGLSTTGKGLTYSRGIGQGKARSQLESKIIEICPDANGLTIKIPATQLDFNALQQAYYDVVDQMADVQKAILTAEAGDIIVPAPTAIEKTFFEAHAGAGIATDSLVIFQLLKACSKKSPDVKIKHMGGNDIWEEAGISDAFENCLLRRVELTGGGSIVIDDAEALTAIDVNGGGLDSMNKGDDAIFRLNKRAAKAMARQIAVRNISGLIVIDFVRLKNRGMQKQLPKILAADLRAYDPNGTWDVMDITKSGLVEVTRKRTRPSLNEIMFTPLQDRQLNVQTASLELLQKLLGLTGAGVPSVYGSKAVLDCLKKGSLKALREQVETTLAKEIEYEESSMTGVEFKR